MKTNLVILVFLLAACGGDPAKDAPDQQDAGDALEVLAPDTDAQSNTCLADADCDDHNPCTQDLCSPQLGCLFSPLGGSCDDGDSCTQGDSCQNGLCVGSAIPGCGASVCGDHHCADDETCATCPADCSPLGAAACGPACDPLADAPSCPANFACLPTKGSAPAASILDSGNGVCGAPCDLDTDCQGGLCLKSADLGGKGVCAVSCQTSNAEACGPLARCLPAAGLTGLGYCLLGEACSPEGDAPCDCLALPDLASGGVCLEPCFFGPAQTCPNSFEECQARADSAYHQGLCVGQDQPCDPAAQSGCGEAETCAPVGGPGILGVARLCLPAAGTQELGSGCGEASGGCAAGLFCDGAACRATCAPGGAGCAEGDCRDIGATLGLDAGVLGLCVLTCGDCADCGDGTCQEDESCDSCAADCGDCPWCGDADCNGEEDCQACEEDCGPCPWCGDEACNGQENCATCAADCGQCDTTCGDNACSPAEFCFTCPEDCGACSEGCGDSHCGADETCYSCLDDCGACPWHCGDGECNDGEGCTTCPGDCPLLGLGACSGGCDPLLAPTGCGQNQVCVPTLDGNLHLDAFATGDGVCAEGCTGDSDCGDGACLLLEGLEVSGICGASCAPGEAGDCGEDQRCVASPEAPTKGVCVVGGACTFGNPCEAPFTNCTGLKGSATDGLCLPGCLAPEDSCGALACLRKAGAQWHSGSCLGQAVPCDPFAQTGCAPDETCRILAGPGIVGLAKVCDPHTGEVGFGVDCEPGVQACLPGLVCLEGVCASYCSVALPVCAQGDCFDFSGFHSQPPGSVGVCF